ncbi:MAG: NapC/NirT family cytochrome c [Candidatus Omnitrophica bacterium]|nr:NapC/NirT family cytochrome c [Candidatus Omnitrophota bacterium]
MAENPSSNSEKSYFQNWISVIGAISSIFFFSIILFLFILDLFVEGINPYLGSVTYFFLPICLIAGLLLIPLGAWRERRRRHKKGQLHRFPLVDFNNPLHQKIAYVSIGVVTLFLLFTMVGTYKAYEFTESPEFCGLLCHQVMAPEYTAYHESPHARVACASCHVGHGFDWYLRSKASGTYQLYSILFNKYHRPIETPIKNMRPARETCERCHWPSQNYGMVEKDLHYFLPDEQNTQWKTRMMLFVGGQSAPYQYGEGIHWHMNVNHQVFFIAADKEQEKIPWVKSTGPNGKEEIYIDEDTQFTASQPPAGVEELMDCMDCHNRPSHQFRAPSRSVNEAMKLGFIAPALPYMKREAVKALTAGYATTEEALEGIRMRLEKFYSEKYPEIFKEKKDQLNQSIQTLQQIYSVNFFPQMKVSWKAYPEHIGHMISTGCFRCHDGKHKTTEGKAISNKCETCHAIVAQGPPEAMETSMTGLEFRHPDQTEEGWKEMSCTDCHDGALA